MFSILKDDFRTNNVKFTLLSFVKSYLSNYAFKAVVLYRVSHFLHNKGYSIFATLLRNRCIKVTGCEISPKAKIGSGLKLSHSVGIVISGEAIIGENNIIGQNVTIGGNYGRHPVIGSNCYIGVGAIIIGGITIDNNVRVGANAVVIKDIPSNSTAVGVPAKNIEHIT
ncbi:serine O-acetyltransferase [Peribacillus sp. FSL M8-0224]|uniref:serine O-acetyltransferase n=1 Tax=Peribacillus sp. FSL M8-0224 TaxID=2921568 RepID=UPI0030F99A93